MATKPVVSKLTASTVDILNAIRNDATQMYQNYVPIAQQEPANVKAIGSAIMQFPALQNEFLTALVNRIAFVKVRNMEFSNPYARFKKGVLDFGETIEDIFVEIAEPFRYDPAVAASKVFARQIPDVRSAFHVLNYQEFYKVTIQNNDLRKAFLSYQGVEDLISRIVNSLYVAAEYDEFLVTKYMLMKHILAGHMYPVAPSGATTTSDAKDYRAMSNLLEFPSTQYNMSGVHNVTKKDSQYLFMTAAADAAMDVDVLAAAFNMDKAEFMGHRIVIDTFSDIDNDRLALIFKDDPNYVAISSDDLALLANVNAVLVDVDWFMIYDNLLQFTEQYNGEGLYWNYWYHTWKTFSASPFENAIVFANETSNVTAISVSPATATIPAPVKGTVIHFSAEVTKTGFANEQVEWSISDNAEDYARIDESGNVLITDVPDSATAITVTAKSVFKPSVSGTATLTIGAN